MLARMLLAIAMFVLLPSDSWAEITREQITRGKQATALVELPNGRMSTTATCVHKSGTFITTRHSVKDLALGAGVKLVLNPSQDNRRELQAKVLRLDESEDLAVLQLEAKPEEEFASLPLGDDSKLFETLQVTAFGYPQVKRSLNNLDPYPDLTVIVARITSLPSRKGILQRVQLDSTLNAGNAGGPLINGSGELVGIIDTAVNPTGVNLVIPVHAVRQLLKRPDVAFDLPVVTEADKHTPVEFRVRVTPFLQPLNNLEVELQLLNTKHASRTLRLTAEEPNQYVIKASAVPAPDPQEVRWLPGTIQFAAGQISGRIQDQPLKIGERQLNLADLRSIQWPVGTPAAPEPPRATTGDTEPLPVTEMPTTRIIQLNGVEHNEKPTGLDKVQVDLGEYQLPIELGQARRLELQHITVSDWPVRYVLHVRDGDQALRRLEGELGPGSAAKVVKSQFVPYTGERQILEVPNLIGDALLAAGGRLLLLHLPQSRRIAVYDVNEAKISRYLTLTADKVQLAAGLHQLIVLSPTERVVQRWSLETFEKEATAPIPITGVVKRISMGYATDGPLLILWSRSSDDLAVSNYQFFETNNFTSLSVKPFQGHHSSHRDQVHVRAAGTGKLFGTWTTSQATQGMETFLLQGDNVKASYQHQTAGYIVPNFDGSQVLTATAGVYTPTLEQRPSTSRLPLIPSTHPRLYISVPADPGLPRNVVPHPQAGLRGSVYAAGNDLKLTDLPLLELGTSQDIGSWTAGDLTLDKRVVYIPQANQIVALPFTNDRVIVLPFNLKAILEKTSVDYFYVQSVPPRTFVKGEQWQYQLEAASRRPGVTYALSSGPQGMTVDASGKVEWLVPLTFAESSVDVSLILRNAAGQSVVDSFKLTPQ